MTARSDKTSWESEGAKWGVALRRHLLNLKTSSKIFPALSGLFILTKMVASRLYRPLTILEDWIRNTSSTVTDCMLDRTVQAS